LPTVVDLNVKLTGDSDSEAKFYKVQLPANITVTSVFYKLVSNVYSITFYTSRFEFESNCFVFLSFVLLEMLPVCPPYIVVQTLQWKFRNYFKVYCFLINLRENASLLLVSSLTNYWAKYCLMRDRYWAEVLLALV